MKTDVAVQGPCRGSVSLFDVKCGGCGCVITYRDIKPPWLSRFTEEQMDDAIDFMSEQPPPMRPRPAACGVDFLGRLALMENKEYPSCGGKAYMGGKSEPMVMKL